MAIIKKIIKKTKEGYWSEFYIESKWIYRYAYTYKWSIVVYILFGMLSTIMALGSSVVSKILIDSVIVLRYGDDAALNMAVTGDAYPLYITGPVYVAMGLAVIVANAMTNRVSAKIDIKVNNEIKADIYDKILEADWEASSEYHSGDLLNRLNSDVSAVSSSVLGWIPNLITKSFQFIGAFILILHYDKTLALLALASAPFTILVSRTLMKRMRKYNKMMKEASSNMLSFNQESFQNVQTIKSFGMVRSFGKKMRNVQKEYAEVALDYNKFSVGTSALMNLAGLVVSVLCFGWGIFRLWKGYISYGTMTMFLQLAGTLSAAFSALVGLVPSAIAAATSAGRLMAVAELPKENYDNEPEVEEFLESIREDGVCVKIENAEFTYNDGNEVFKNADFYAGAGEIVALVGPSGEGKTTLLRLLLSIVKITEGFAVIERTDGYKSVEISAATRKLFSYVPQGNTVFSGTVAENIRMLKPDATEEEIIEALKLACAYDFVARLPLGIHNRVGEHGGGFSEGQAQRLAIARAIVSDAPILLLDEATSALDVATERKVLKNIMGYNKKKTCILTTHRPSVLGVCNRVYRISDYKIEQMKHEEIEVLVKDF